MPRRRSEDKPPSPRETADPSLGEPIERARNLGPICAAELRAIQIETVAELRRLGWERALELWVAAFPARANLNAAAGLIGAVEDVDWRRIPLSQKAEARELIARLKAGRD